MENESKKGEEMNKPRSRLLLMKDRLKSQRKLSHGDKLTKTEDKVSKSGERKKSSSKVSKSHSFTEADKPNGLSSAKKSLFGGGKHKKAQSAEMDLNGQGSYLTDAQAKPTAEQAGKNIGNKNSKKPSDPLRFFTSSKVLKSKSFDVDVEPLDESGEGMKLQKSGNNNNSSKQRKDGRLNKSLELESSYTSKRDNNNSNAEKKLSGLLKMANGSAQREKDQSTGQTSSTNSGRSIRSAIGSHFGFGFHGNSSKGSNTGSKSPAKEGRKQTEKNDISYQIHRKIENQPSKKTSSSIQYTLKPKIKQEVPLVNPESSSGSEGGFEGQSKTGDTSLEQTEKWKGSSEYLDRCQTSAGSSSQTDKTQSTTNNTTSLSLAVSVSTLPRTGRVPLPKSTSAGLSQEHTQSDKDKPTTVVSEALPRNSMAAFHGRSVSTETAAGFSSSLSKPEQPQDRAPYLKMDFREGGHVSRSLSPERGGTTNAYHLQKYAFVNSKNGPQYSEDNRSNSTSSRTSQDFAEKRNVNLGSHIPPPSYEKVNHIREGPYVSAQTVHQAGKDMVRDNIPRQTSWGNAGYAVVSENVQQCQLSHDAHSNYSKVPPSVKSGEFTNAAPNNKNGPGHSGYYSTLPHHGGSTNSSNARFSHLHASKEPVYYRHRLGQMGEGTNRNSAIYHSNQSRPKPIIRQSQSLEDLLDSDCNINNLRYNNPQYPGHTEMRGQPNSKESINSASTTQTSFDNCVPRNNTRSGGGGPYCSDYKPPRDNSCPPALDYQRVDYQNNNNNKGNDSERGNNYGQMNPNFQNNRRNLQLSDVVKPPVVETATNKHSSPYSGVNNNNNSYSSASDVSQYQDRIDALKTEFKKHFEDNNNDVPGKVKDFSDLSNKLDAHIIMNENEGVYHVRRELSNIPDVARTGPTAFEKQNSSNYEYLNRLNRDKSNERRDKEYSAGVYSVQSGQHSKVIPYGKDEGDYVSSAQIQALKAASGDYAVLYQGQVVPESSNYATVEELQKQGGLPSSGGSSGVYHHRNGSSGSSDQRYVQSRVTSQGYGDYGKLSRLERISEGDYDTLKERQLDKISEGSQESVEEVEHKKPVQREAANTTVSTPPNKRNGLKVTNPDDLKGQSGQKGTPSSMRGGSVQRRHTVTTGKAEQEFQSMRRDEDQLPYSRQPIKSNHPLQSGRNESYYEAVREEDRLSTKSESESPVHSAFTRGGRLRSSLPIVRSPNKSLDKPMGLVFLIYRNETKRALLPNEVTSMDTIRALFVRAFCDQLNMRWFDGQGRKIYVMDAGTNVYYELEDLRDIKDRSVLKIYEPDYPFNMRSPSLSPHPREGLASNHHGYESDSSVRSAPPMVPRSPMHQSHPPPTHRTYVQDVTSKTSSLPVQPTYAYHQPPKSQYNHNNLTGTSSNTAASTAHHTNGPVPSQGSQGGVWGSPTHQRSHGSPSQGRGTVGSPTTHRPLSQVSPLARTSQGSPVRSPGHQNNRHSVAYLPPNSADFHSNQLPQSQSYHDYPDHRSSGSVTPSVEDSETRERMQRMEAQLASLTAMVQSAVVLKSDGSGGGSRPGSARSNSSLVSDTSCSIKSKTMFPSICPGSKLRYRYPQVGMSMTDSLISDSTTPTIHSPSLSSSQGVSDSSTATPQPIISIEIQNNMRALYQRARELRTEVNKLRKMQINNSETMQETIYETFKKIKAIIEKVPGAEDQPLRHQRQEVNSQMYCYQEEAHRVESDLSDLALSVDDLRQDVLTKGCRINKEEIQNMALTLSNISKSLGDLKCRFPHLQQNMKTVLAGEMEVVVKEEKFLQQEPEYLDEQLKKCEKVMKVLLTLKRLGSVQEAKPLVQPTLFTQKSPTSGDRRRILENIEAMAPDHGNRLASTEAAEAARERKKKIQSNAEAMRFEKALDQAQKQLRTTTTNIPVTTGASNNKQQQRASQSEARPDLNDLELEKAGAEPVTKLESPGSPKIPLTDTTKRLSKVNQNKDSSDSGSQGQKKKKARDVTEEGRTERLKPSSPDEDVSGIKTQNSGVSSPTNALNANTSGSSIQSQISRLSTFGLPGMTSTPNGDSGQTQQTSENPNEKALSPSSQSKSQNNGSVNRVSFSSTVTEIPSLSSSSQDGARPKKVPPPPPPRKSSRSTVLSPSANKVSQRLQLQSGSPPTYENIDNFPKKGQSNNSPNPTNASKLPNSPTSRIPQVSGTKPMTRYQQELASGIYANLNRPDLQEQKMRPMEAVKTASLDKSPEDDTEESESSSEESQGTVKRRPASKETSPQPPTDNKDSMSSADQSKHSIIGEESQPNDGKRLPPPPPVRKTSTLSQNATEIQNIQSVAGTKLSPDGGSKIPKMSSGFLQKKLTNGDLKSSKSVRDRQYNETEIY